MKYIPAMIVIVTIAAIALLGVVVFHDIRFLQGCRDAGGIVVEDVVGRVHCIPSNSR